MAAELAEDDTMPPVPPRLVSLLSGKPVDPETARKHMQYLLDYSAAYPLLF